MSAYDQYQSSDTTPEGETLTRIEKLVEELIQADAAIEHAEAALKRAQEHRNDIAQHRLPELMEQGTGLTELRTRAGMKVTIKDIITASIKVECRPLAYKWLEDNNHGAMIKRTVVAAFNKGEEEQAGEAMKELRGYGMDVKQELKVEPSTLRAWVVKQLQDGAAIPTDLITVHQIREAKVTV